MLLRGYRLREREIIGRLVESVFDGIQDVLINLLQLAGDIEFYLSMIGFKRLAEDSGLDVCLPEFTRAGAERPSELKQLFNPFLLLEDSPPIPCDLTVDPQSLVVITGPNSGGKTRLLQAVGLTQVLAQAGGFVPASRARLSWVSGIFVSLIHEVSADQKEGRLGTELMRIRRLFEQLDVNNIVILDELCSGTNPSEGEEIFRLVISLLRELGPQAFITTHFLQFAARLERERPIPELRFLQVELDDRLRPLYSFVPGVASTSLAQRTAERLGVTREALEALIAAKKARFERRSVPAPPAEAALPSEPGHPPDAPHPPSLPAGEE
jgi:DNA mismatch repair protein MutS2